MPKIKFPCGHKGKGKFCHRCAEAAKPPKDKSIKFVENNDPIICQDCGNETDFCICPPAMTVGEFRERQDKVFKESIERIKKDLGDK